MSIADRLDRLADAIERMVAVLIDLPEIARLSPAPVGGEAEAEAREAGRANAKRICAKVYGDPNRHAPTPPPAEPDGGEGRTPWRIAHDLGWLRGQLANDIADGYDPPVTPDGHGVIDTMGEAISAIADLEQRLAAAEATLAERDRRIAELEAGLKQIEANDWRWASFKDINNKEKVAGPHATIARGLLSPATDKGGE